MAIRKIIRIDEEKCNGCGDCVPNCAEGAIQIIEGKARLVSEIYCDGLGACLGTCPMDAIHMEERDAPEFDEEAVHKHLTSMNKPVPPPVHAHGGGCPGSAVRSMPTSGGCPGSAMRSMQPATGPGTSTGPQQSQLGQWPVQLMLVPPMAPFLRDSDLLLCADCVPFALNGFHEKYLQGRTLLVGCPKLDNLDFYRDKLKDVLKTARPRRVTVLRMEVPCCGGLAHIAREARDSVATDIPLEIHIVSVDGRVVSEEKF